MRNYLTKVLRILSANSIRNVGPDEMKGVRHQVYEASRDQNIPMANRPTAAVTTFKGLDTIVFTVQWLCCHNIAPDVNTVNSLIPVNAVRYWTATYHYFKTKYKQKLCQRKEKHPARVTIMAFTISG